MSQNLPCVTPLLFLRKCIFRSNKATIVPRAGCLSPLSIRLCPEHSWISRDISADASLWDEWVFTQHLPRRSSRQRRRHADRLPALQNETLLMEKNKTKKAETSPSLAKGSWLTIGMENRMRHLNLILL